MTVSNVTLPAQGTGTTTPIVESAQIAPDGVSVRQVMQIASFGDNTAGTAIAVGNGISGTGVQRVTIASDSTGTVAATQSGVWTIATTQSGSWTVAATQSGTWTVGISASQTIAVTQATAANLNATAVLAAGSAIIGNVRIDQTTPGTTNGVSVAQIGATTVSTGTGAQGAGAQRVTVATDTATIAGSAPGTAGTASANVLSVQGPTAAAATLAANPATIGGRAATANPTAVTDGQVVNTMHDKLGKLVAVGAIRILKGSQKATLSNTTSETTIVTAVSATFLDLYGLILANSGATTTKVDIRDDTGGAIITTIEVPTLETRGFMLPVDSAIPQTAVNKNWTAQCASATTALEVTSLYVKNI